MILHQVQVYGYIAYKVFPFSKRRSVHILPFLFSDAKGGCLSSQRGVWRLVVSVLSSACGSTLRQNIFCNQVVLFLCTICVLLVPQC
jgi:hypothetical protein